MTPRRRLLAAASATAALVSLTGCEKPAPLVTVVSGGSSVNTEAFRFCFEEGATLEKDGCSERATEVPRLEVRPGDRIGVDVDKEVKDRGWQLEVADPADPERTQGTPALDDSYFRFSVPDIAPGGRLMLTVRTVDAQNAPTGEWRFELANRD